MAEKKDHSKSPETNELGIIRDILMGQHMAENKAEFERTHQQMAADRKELADKLKARAASTDERFSKLEKEVGNRFDRLEKMLAENIARLDQKLIEMSKADKQDLGQMLAELGKKLTT